MQTRKPDWLKIRLRGNGALNEVNEMLKELSLHTVCEEANCPNLMECFSKKTATFLILGNICTRNCTFCNVPKGIPLPDVNPLEPANVAEAVAKLKLKHVVITSVTRDDLLDGGAGQYALIIEKIRELDNKIIVEVLIPDFQGDHAALSIVAQAQPRIINHNIETVPRLYPEVRPKAIYQRSLDLLRNVKALDENMLSKSGIMVGLGETSDEVAQVMGDLRRVDCDILTIGQYLAPSKNHHPVVEYIHPDIFAKYKEFGLSLGFRFVASSPLVRSSYHAEEMLK